MNIPDNIRVNASFPFPALVQGSGPITLTKINGIWTIGYNGALLGSINTSAPITGGPVGPGSTIGLALSGVVPGSYTSANITVDQWGRILAAVNGSGGGGGGSVVPTVPALAAISPSVGAVVVSDIVKGGVFLWNSANVSGYVAADPQHGIWMPLTGTNGSTGAWMRLYGGPAEATWWPFVGDGVITFGPPTIQGVAGCTFSTTVVSGTDNNPGFNALWPWARYESSQGHAVNINFKPGNYNWNGGTITEFGTYAIKKLHVTGYGANFTNIYNETVSGASFQSNPWFFSAAALVTGPTWAGDGVIPAGIAQPLSFLINSTTVGATTITLINPARTSYFSVGEFVMIGSLDIQMSGFPPNCQFNEFVQIQAINAGTGVITFVEPLKYQHLSTFTDYQVPPSNWFCGKARIWKLDTTGYGYGLPTPWDLDQTLEGITVNQPPGRLGSFYSTISMRKLQTINYTGPGWSETVLGSHVGQGDRYTSSPEIDKLIGNITYRDSTFDWGIGFQSSSVENAVFDNCDINSIGFGAKQTTVNNCRIKYSVVGATINLGCTQGMAGPTTITNSKLEAYISTVIPFIMDVSQPLTISTDGSTPLTYANGQVIMNKATAGGLPPSFAAIPGQYVLLCPPGPNQFVGDMGLGIILSITEDATNVYWNTTIPFATLPSWAVSGVTATITKFMAADVNFVNCNGSDNARIVSEACANGMEYWNLKTYEINGTSSGGLLSGWMGDVILADIDVIHPSNNVNDIVNWTFSTSTFNGTSFVADSGGTILTINHGIQGRRTVTKNMFVGKQGTDKITVGAPIVDFLPSNRFLLPGAAQWGIEPPSSNPSQTPLIRAQFAFSTGNCRKRLTALANQTTGFMLPTVGLIT